MKKAIFLASLTFASLSLLAQSKQSSIDVSFGPEASLPLGDFNTSFSFGAGATAKVAYNFTENMAATLQAGYIAFLGKSVDDLGQDETISTAGFVPFKAGFRYTLKGGFYAEPQLGFTRVSSEGESTTGFTYAFNVGYRMRKGLDLALRYETVSETGGSLSFVGLRAAYTFSIGGK